jgi:hypothetical protein
VNVTWTDLVSLALIRQSRDPKMVQQTSQNMSAGGFVPRSTPRFLLNICVSVNIFTNYPGKSSPSVFVATGFKNNFKTRQESQGRRPTAYSIAPMSKPQKFCTLTHCPDNERKFIT